ncbi:hypothetical protein OQZ28_10680, partial [Komagataeibacter sp. NFXK3]
SVLLAVVQQRNSGLPSGKITLPRRSSTVHAKRCLAYFPHDGLNLFVIKAPNGPLFDGDNPRESMAAFLGDILDAFIRGDLARALDAEPGEEESSRKD